MTAEDSNDNDPQFIPPYIVHVSEAAQVNSVVGTLTATDSDAGVNGQVTFSLLSNTHIFSIGSSDGTLKVGI